MQFSTAQRAVAVVPGDTSASNFSPCEALWISVGGTLSFVPNDPGVAVNATGTSVAVTVPAGLFPVKCVRVNTTGTAATGIVALY